VAILHILSFACGGGFGTEKGLKRGGGEQADVSGWQRQRGLEVYLCCGRHEASVLPQPGKSVPSPAAAALGVENGDTGGL
jgi:hypothetical protein